MHLSMAEKQVLLKNHFATIFCTKEVEKIIKIEEEKISEVLCDKMAKVTLLVITSNY